MKEHDRGIPFEQRFQTGIVVTKAIDVSALHVNLLHCPWAKRARIRQEELPKDKRLSEYNAGQRLTIFLLNPSKVNAEFYQASLRWAVRAENPWLNNPPHKGSLVEATATDYLSKNTGVFVRLPSGIRSLLRVSEIPGKHQDITACIDIGDRLLVEIIDVNKDLLQVSTSVNHALTTLRAEEHHRRTKEFSLGTVRNITHDNWSLTAKPHIKLAILADHYFSQNLASWLNSFGIETRVLESSNHLLRILPAPNPPTHLLCAPEKWPIERLHAKQFETVLTKANINLTWLTNSQEAVLPINILQIDAARLSLPLKLYDLLRLLEDKPFPIDEQQQTTNFQINAYQTRHVHQLAKILLANFCKQHQFHAAFWVKRERKGVYAIHAWHNLQEETLGKLEPFLAQTFIANSIENNRALAWETSKLGKLLTLVPKQSDHAISIPVPYHEISAQTQQDAPPERSVVFFYRAADQPDNLAKLLEQHIPAIQALIDTLHFAEHNETLSAFASLGLTSASYLHELGQAASPLRDFIQQHDKPADINIRDWRALKKNTQRLLNMADGDLAILQHQRIEHMRLRERLQRISEIYSYRFNTINCAFSVSMPTTPMTLSLSPLIIEQVLSNLLDNALYFVAKLDNAGRVSISVSLDTSIPERPLVIDVADNGSGVPASMQQRIFQLRDSGKNRGTGMGLHISRSYLDGIGAQIELLGNSVRWQHTCFRIRLPIVLDIYNRGD